MIRKKNERIQELKNENKTLKTASQNSRYSHSGSTHSFHNIPLDPLSSTLTSLSPDEIMINIAELESSSLSSDSDDSSENSIIIFTNSPLEHSDDNAGSESFSTFMDNQDSVELSQNEHPDDATEFRNAQSQTVEDWSTSEQQNDAQYNRNGSPSNENVSVAVEAPDSLYDDTEERSQVSRSVKRRPTTQKPAKRRLPPPSPVTSDDDDDDDDQSSSFPCSLDPSKPFWRDPSTGILRRYLVPRPDYFRARMEAGPSSAPPCDLSLRHSVPDTSTNTKWRFRSRAKLNQKNGKEKSNVSSGSEILNPNAIPTGNAVFERTLALLEQYNLESDPEWLPEYASHRGNDTTTESDSSVEAEFIDDSSSSDASDSNNEEDSNTNHNSPSVDFMNW